MKQKGGSNWLFLMLLGIGVLVAIGSVIVIIGGLLALMAPQEDCIGVVEVAGTIVAGSSPGGLFSEAGAGSDDIAALLEEANSRSEVKAVLVEVNSGGGSVVGSREIYESVKELDKPNVAYFREVAASGGYYVGAGTDYIVSDPDALTGSIGVRATLVDMSGLFEKIGYNQTVITSGEMKDMGDPGRPMTEEEVAVFQGIVDEIFVEFKTVVEEERGDRLNQEGFEEILDARILTGRQAQRIGLVDETGNRNAALRKAAQLANMSYEGDVPPVCRISKSEGLFDAAFSGAANVLVAALKEALRISAGAQGVRLEY